MHADSIKQGLMRALEDSKKTKHTPGTMRWQDLGHKMQRKLILTKDPVLFINTFNDKALKSKSAIIIPETVLNVLKDDRIVASEVKRLDTLADKRRKDKQDRAYQQKIKDDVIINKEGLAQWIEVMGPVIETKSVMITPNSSKAAINEQRRVLMLLRPYDKKLKLYGPQLADWMLDDFKDRAKKTIEEFKPKHIVSAVNARKHEKEKVLKKKSRFEVTEFKEPDWSTVVEIKSKPNSVHPAKLKRQEKQKESLDRKQKTFEFSEAKKVERKQKQTDKANRKKVSGISLETGVCVNYTMLAVYALCKGDKSCFGIISEAKETFVDEYELEREEARIRIKSYNKPETNVLEARLRDISGYSNSMKDFKKKFDVDMNNLEDVLNVTPGEESYITTVLNVLKTENIPTKILNVLVPSLIFMSHLYKSKTYTDYFTNSYQYILAMGLPIHETLEFCMREFFNEDKKLFNMNLDELLKKPVISTEAWIDEAEKFKNSAYNFIKSGIVTSIRNIVVSIVSMKFFDKKLSSKIFDVLGKPKEKMGIIDSVGFITDQIFTILRVGHNVVSGVPFSQILLESDPIRASIREGMNLAQASKTTYVGLPVPGCMAARTLLLALRDLIITMKRFKDTLSPTTEGYKDMVNMMYKLEDIKHDIEMDIAGSNRPMPAFVVLWGPPGIGKANILTLITMILCKVMGVTNTADIVYPRVKSSDYFEGYDPLTHIVIHYSEVGNEVDQVLLSSGCKVQAEITSLVDGRKFCPNMAFDKKGKVSATPWLLMCDSNRQFLGYEVMMTNIAALARRGIFVKPHVKPEFVDSGGVALDVGKSLESNLPLMDRWYFEVTKYKVISGGKGFAPDYILKPEDRCDVYQFVQCMHDLFTDHFSKQSTVLTRLNSSGSFDQYFSEDIRSNFELMAQARDAAVENGEFYDNILNIRPLPQNVVVKSESGQILTKIHAVIQHGLFSSKAYTRINFLFDVVMRFSTSLCIGLLSGGISALLWGAITILRGGLGSWILSPIKKAYLYRFHQEFTILGAMLGLKKNHFVFASDWWKRNHKKVKTVLAIIATATVSYKLVCKMNPKNDVEVLKDDTNTQTLTCSNCNNGVRSEAVSDFKKESPFNNIIMSYEEKSGCEYAGAIVPIVGTNMWNVQTHDMSMATFHGVPEDLSKLVRRNSRNCKIIDIRDRKTYLLGLCNDVCVINKHALPTTYPIIVQISKTGMITDKNTVWDTVRLNEQDIVVGTEDFAYFRARGMNFKNLLPHLTDNDYGPMAFESLFFGTKVYSNYLKGPHFINDAGGDFYVDNLFVYDYPDHKPGMCGLPLVVKKNSTSVVAGIHIGGKGSQGFALPLNKAEIIRISGKLNDTFTPIYNDTCVYTEGLLCPVKKSAFRHEVLHGVTYFGSQPGVTLVKNKSRLKHFDISDDLLSIIEEEYNFVPSTIYVRPIMEPVGTGENYKSPYNVALKAMSKQKASLDTVIMNSTVDYLVNHFIVGLAKEGVYSLSPLTMEEAINGSVQDRFYRRVNASTSAGYGLKGKKGDHLPLVNDFTREALSELKGKIVTLMDAYTAGNCVKVICEAHLKDEPRNIDKVNNADTRVFYATSLDILILSKMFLSPFYVLMQKFGKLFCCAIGINMFCDVGDLVKLFKIFSNKYMVGDFKKYDLSVPFDIRLVVCTIIKRMLVHLGYSQQAIIIACGIMSSKLFPIIKMLQDLFMTPGNQPSGWESTTQDNCLCLLVLYVYAWHALGLQQDNDFFENVLLETFGDDSMRAIKDRIGHRFNNHIFAEFCASTYNMTYTAAEKDAELKMFDSFEDLSFLKRNFYYRSDEKFWVGLLDMNSIHKSLNWYTPSKHINPVEQVTQTISSALWELALYSDNSKHDRIRNRILCVLHRRYSETITFPLPSYNDIWERIKRKEDVSEYILKIPLQLASNAIDLSSYTPIYNTGVTHLCTESGTVDEPQKSWNTDHGLGIDYHDLINRYANNDEYYVREPEDYSSVLQRKFFYEEELKNAQAAFVALEDDLGQLSVHQYRSLLPCCTSQVRRDGLNRRIRLKSAILNLVDTIAMLERIIDNISGIVTQSGESGVMSDGTISEQVVDQNLTDVIGDDIKINDVGSSMKSSAGQQIALDISNYLERPVLIYQRSIANGADVDMVINPWDLFTLNNAVRSKLRNSAYLKGKLHVRIAISGTPFHYGRWYASPQYFSSFNDVLQQVVAASAVYRQIKTNYLLQAKGTILMDPCENKPAEIELPFMSPKPMWRLFNDSAIALAAGTSYTDLSLMGSLYMGTLNQFHCISATPTACFIQVYAWMTEVELGAATASVIGIATEAGHMDERKTGPIERIASRASSLATAMLNIFPLHPWVVASSVASGALAKVASIFGWSKPLIIERPHIVKNTPYQNGSNTIGCDTNMKICLDPMQELTVDGRILGIEEDELVISSICNIPGKILTFTWSNTDEPFVTQLFYRRVTPCLAYTTTNVVQPTPLAYMAALFDYWRGDIIFRFEFVCSQYHRGKVAVYTEPNVYQSALIDAAVSTNKQYMKVVDIQETQVFEVCVNWQSFREWNKVNLATDINLYNGGSNTRGAGYCNGYIAMVPFTKLQSPDNSNIEVNVYVYSTDMHFNRYSYNNVSGERDGIPTESGHVVMTPQEITCLELNDSKASVNDINVLYFGEAPYSLRALLKRYVTIQHTSVGSNATVGGKRLLVIGNIIPPIVPAIGDATTTYPQLFGYLRYAFVALRGSLRYRMHPTVSLSSNNLAHIKIGLQPEGSSVTESAAFDTSSVQASPDGTVTFVPHTNAGIEVEFPFYTNNLFGFSFNSNPFPASTGGFFDEVATRQFNYQQEAEAPTGGSIAFRFIRDFAIGEDFTFMKFNGAPYYTIP